MHDIVTTTTHKTLRGPSWWFDSLQEKYAKAIDKSIFPGIQGGPLMHVIAAKAVALGEALQPEVQKYMRNKLSTMQKHWLQHCKIKA